MKTKPKDSQAAVAKFTAEERAAMKSRVKELKAAADKAEGEKAALAAIAEMQETDRTMAKRLHAIVKSSAPELSARTWYGMPAYYRGSKVVCFFQDRLKFKFRYATLGFSDGANLDEGTMWPIYYALTKMTAADESRIAALIKKAAS